MNVKEIKELVDLVARRGLAALEIERAGFRLRIEGAPRPLFSSARRAPEAPPDTPVALEPEAPASPARSLAPPAASRKEDALHYLTSPIVGTFYRAPSPEAEPYTKVGDEVEKGKTLCLVEAMKLMNEIEADTSGTVVAVYPQNGQPVEFGERLFAIQPR
jgi:acetyl-CoA carboxylase biotin carboxyl carrier protein